MYIHQDNAKTRPNTTRGSGSHMLTQEGTEACRPLAPARRTQFFVERYLWRESAQPVSVSQRILVAVSLGILIVTNLRILTIPYRHLEYKFAGGSNLRFDSI